MKPMHVVIAVLMGSAIGAGGHAACVKAKLREVRARVARGPAA